MQLAGDVGVNGLAEAALIGRVYVSSTPGMILNVVGLPFLEHLRKAFLDGGKLCGCENADFGVGAGVGNAAPDVLGENGAVKIRCRRP